MSEQEARSLATAIAKGSDGVRVKTGRTNGRVCLHLIADHRVKDEIAVPGLAYSETLYDPSEWTYHPENKRNRPSKREQRETDKDLADAVANREAA